MICIISHPPLPLPSSQKHWKHLLCYYIADVVTECLLNTYYFNELLSETGTCENVQEFALINIACFLMLQTKLKNKQQRNCK